MKVLKVLRGLLLKKSPKQGLGQSPKVFLPPVAQYPVRHTARVEAVVRRHRRNG